MIYDYSNRIVYSEEKEIGLTKLESRLLMLLSDNEMHNYIDINKYVFKVFYKKIGKQDKRRIITLACRLNKKMKKIKIKVINKFKIGYCIEEEIYLTDSRKISTKKINMKERKYLYRLLRGEKERHEKR